MSLFDRGYFRFFVFILKEFYSFFATPIINKKATFSFKDDSPKKKGYPENANLS